MSFVAEPKAGRRVNQWTEVSVAGVKYLRLPLHTRWLDETDDLVLTLKDSLKPARPGDTVGVSEKVVILLTGRTVDISTMKPGRLARFLAAPCPPAHRFQGAGGPGKDGVRRTHRRLEPDHPRDNRLCPDSAVGHAWNVLSNRRTDRPRCRRRTPAVRARALPTLWMPRSRRPSVPTSSRRWTSASASSTSTTSAARSARSPHDHCLRRRWQPCSATTRWANGSRAHHSCWFGLPERHRDHLAVVTARRDRVSLRRQVTCDSRP